MGDGSRVYNLHIETIPMPQTLQELLVRLKWISNIKRGQKMNLSNLTYSDPTWYESFKRFVSSESRSYTIEYLKNNVTSALDIISEYRDSVFIITILEHLQNSVVGLQNLLETYKNDPEFHCRISTIIENINYQLEMNKHFISGRIKKSD
jgi:hypothetical protein